MKEHMLAFLIALVIVLSMVLPLFSHNGGGPMGSAYPSRSRVFVSPHVGGMGGMGMRGGRGSRR